MQTKKGKSRKSKRTRDDDISSPIDDSSSYKRNRTDEGLVQERRQPSQKTKYGKTKNYSRKVKPGPIVDDFTIPKTK